MPGFIFYLLAGLMAYISSIVCYFHCSRNCFGFAYMTPLHDILHADMHPKWTSEASMNFSNRRAYPLLLSRCNSKLLMLNMRGSFLREHYFILEDLCDSCQINYIPKFMLKKLHSQNFPNIHFWMNILSKVLNCCVLHIYYANQYLMDRMNIIFLALIQFYEPYPYMLRAGLYQLSCKLFMNGYIEVMLSKHFTFFAISIPILRLYATVLIIIIF